MTTNLMDRSSKVAAVINQRRAVAEAKEREELGRAFDRQDEADLLQREEFERRVDIAVAEFAKKTGAAISVEFLGKRISIRMNHAETVVRDIARNAGHLLSQFVTRTMQTGIIAARNTGRADFAVDPLWLERLLSLDLRYAHERGLVSVTDVKTGKPVRLKHLTPAKAVTTTVQTRDAWLAGAA